MTGQISLRPVAAPGIRGGNLLRGIWQRRRIVRALTFSVGVQLACAGVTASRNVDAFYSDRQCPPPDRELCGETSTRGALPWAEGSQPVLPSCVTEGAAALASSASQALAQFTERITEGSAALKETAARLSEQHAALMQEASQAVAQLAEQSAPEATAALKNAAVQLAEQQAAFVQAGSQVVSQLTDWKMRAQYAASQTAAQFAEGVAEGQAAFVEAATQAAGHLSEQQATLGRAVSVVGVQLSERIAQGLAALTETAAQLAEQHAALMQDASQAVTHFAEQSVPEASAALKNAAAQLAEQQGAFVHAAGQAAAQLAERQSEMTHTAGQVAAQLADRLAEGPAVLKAFAGRISEKHITLQHAASKAVAQLTDWQMQVQQAASHSATHFAEGVAEGQAAFVEAATQAAEHFSEQQATLRRAVALVGVQLSERQAMLAKAASQAALQLARSAAGGQEALRQAAATAMAQLDEHEMLLHKSTMLIATQLADFQATLSPSAARIAAGLAELQIRLRQIELGDKAPVDEPLLEPKAFARPLLLAAREAVQRAGLVAHVSCALLSVVALCVGSTTYTICRSGGEDPASLAYGSFVRRVAWWLVHRVCLGWALLLLSDAMAEAPLRIQRYDAMGWPMWSTLLPLSSQLFFFIPAAAILNTAVACGISCSSTPASQRFYASLSREVHAAIVGCFLSDWLLFPTDLVFFIHHTLGLGIVFGVWEMVQGEARLLSAGAPQGVNGPRLTAINFWWFTGLSVAAMEASSFFFNLYSVMNFGAALSLSLFAVFTYSNMLSVMCVLSRHPWGTSAKAIWLAGSQLHKVVQRAQAAFPQLPLPRWISSKTTTDSVSYLSKLFIIVVLCLARHHQMWLYVREQMASSSAIIVGATCVLLASASVWRMRDFEGHRSP